ncbi:MAG: hypothetical protein Q4D62_12920 [Planctomycetia bacterium]|nr:hypothetical protein [Planctomycetia bacterium]
MKRNEKLIEKILEKIIQSKKSSCDIAFEDVSKLFSVDINTFFFHARLLEKDKFTQCMFDSRGVTFDGLTTAGFDYYERLKTPIRSFIKSLLSDHAAITSLIVSFISLGWNIVECFVHMLK